MRVNCKLNNVLLNNFSIINLNCISFYERLYFSVFNAQENIKLGSNLLFHCMHIK